LNRYPRLKQAFNQLSEEGFSNFELQWVGGMAPTLYILSNTGATLKEETLRDMEKSELIDLIDKHGVKLSIATFEMPSTSQDPIIQSTIGGIHYELFLDQLSFSQAQEYSQSRTFEGLKGRLPTIMCQKQQDELKKWIETAGLDESLLSSKGIWLGATDENHEGQWNWISNDKVFYMGSHATLTEVYNNWNEGEPNNANSNEHCATWIVPRAWNDVNCNGKDAQLILVEYGPSESLLCSDSSTTPHASHVGVEDL